VLTILEPSDLAPFASIDPAKADAMVTHVQAMAARVAPCLADTTDDGVRAAAKAILLEVVLRWNEAGSGAFQQQTAGPYGVTVDTRQARRGLLNTSDIEQLQDLCRGTEVSGAFAVDTIPTGMSPHAEICALYFGATYCSCGAILTNLLYPLYEG
jgi:hypothetical protein